MEYATGTMCARCRSPVSQFQCLGESSLYSPGRAFTLCEPCFLEEDAEIDVNGSNVMPEKIEEYKRNLRLGPRRRF